MAKARFKKNVLNLCLKVIIVSQVRILNGIVLQVMAAECRSCLSSVCGWITVAELT